MEAFVVVALVGFVLLAAELLLPTGGVLAALGRRRPDRRRRSLALGSDSSAADYIGPALITLGILSASAFYFITRKVIAAHRDQPVRTGTEEMVGAVGEARSTIDPDGKVWMQGTVWGARLAERRCPGPTGG